MSTLLQVRLTLKQWALVTAAAVIGILLILLRFKEEELAKARVDLLAAHCALEEQKNEEALKAASKRRQELLDAYKKALYKYLSCIDSSNSKDSSSG